MLYRERTARPILQAPHDLATSPYPYQPVRDRAENSQPTPELPISRQPYLVDSRGLVKEAGIVQIRAYADENKDEVLSADWNTIQKLLTAAKSEFFDLVTTNKGLNYFGSAKKASATAASPGKNGAGKGT